MVNQFENLLALLLFQNTTLANIGDATGLVGSSTAGSTQLALASGVYAETDTSLATPSTGAELSYTGYSRPTQARSSAGWTVTNDVASNAALIQFGSMSAGGPVTAVHLGLGFISTGNVLRLQQDLNADLVINNGINPQFSIGALTWTFA